MLLMDDTGSLLRFVQRPNLVDLAEGCHILRSAGRYSELVALLQQHAQYDQALDLLRNLSQDPSRLEVPPKGVLCKVPWHWLDTFSKSQHVHCDQHLL